MSDTLVNMRDVRFVLYELLDVEQLIRLEPFADHSRDTFDIALDAAYKLSKEVFWPAYVQMDLQGVSLDTKNNKATVPEIMHKVWQAAREGDWMGITAPAEWGGQQFPGTVGAAVHFIQNAANTVAHMYIGAAGGAARLILSFGDDALKQTYIEKLFTGQWAGTMCLTEPQAGSSLSDVKTTATPVEGTDYYIIRGTKCFISSGDHDLTENIIHPVLARLPGAPPGVKGISLFVVPRFRVNPDGSVGDFNDVITANFEHKLGLRGNTTATLSFGENDDCRGWLLGEPHKGLRYMFQLMNEARIGTGSQATAVASNAYQQALEYARERLQGRKITEKDPTTPPVPIIRHADVKRMLLVQKSTVEGVFALLAYAALLSDKEHAGATEEEREKAGILLELLTPVCKAYGSEASYESIVQAIQCHGGYGFSEEFPLAQMLRDCKVFSIYEGTNYMQAMDLLGRKVPMKGGAGFKALLDAMTDTVKQASAVEALRPQAEKLGEAVKTVGETTMLLGGIAGKGDIEHYMYLAATYLKMFSPLVVGWLLLWEAVVAQKTLDDKPNETETRFYRGKIATARFYLNHEMPHLQANAQIIQSGERTAIDFDEQWF
jgi:alkylation response protein AidB-like acyl-CoA dehydrogenase